MIDVTKVDWESFKKGLQSIKETVPRWATEKNIKSIEKSIDEVITSIDNRDYKFVMPLYNEEVFKHYLI